MRDLLQLLKGNVINTIEYNDGKRKKKYFNEVYEDVAIVADYLKQKCISQDKRIGVVCKNRYEFEVLDLAAIALGIHFISFHYQDAKNRVEELVSEYNLSLLFVEEELYDQLENNDKILSMNDLVQLQKSGKKVEDVYAKFDEKDIFTTIFTSGSTGIPKGIDVKYSTINDFNDNLVSKFEISTDDKIILFLPLTQYSSRQYVYAAILRGFNVVITEPSTIISDLRYYKPTMLQAVPYFFEGIYDTFISHIKESFLMKIGYYCYLGFAKICPSKKAIAKLQKRLFGEIYDFWGGRMRVMITGAAPIRREVIKFYNDIGLGLYESFGLIETGPITLSYKGSQKIGSVGRVVEGMNISFDADNQIIVDSKKFWGSYYLNASEKENKSLFIEEGKIATGDVGYLDQDNFLYLKGRLKDVIVLTNGTKVHPVVIENELNSTDIVKQSAVFGNNYPFLCVVIVKSSNDIPDDNYFELIKEMNAKNNSNHQVRGIVFAKEAFSVNNDLVSPSMKLNRKKIYEVYKENIEAYYGG